MMIEIENYNAIQSKNIYIEIPIQQRIFPCDSNCFNVLQINIRGMNDVEKLDSLAMFIDSLDVPVDVLIVCETWIKKERARFYKINGYSNVYSCRSQSAGGLAVFVRNGISYEILRNIELDGYHHIQVKIKLKKHFVGFTWDL